MQSQRIVLAARPKGDPVATDFRLEEFATPSPQQNEMLVRVIWLSLDPYMRGRMNDAKSYAPAVQLGATMEAGCVGEVVESNLDGFAAGDFVLGRFGWATHAISDGVDVHKLDASVAPLSTALGVLGMPGLTAFVGLHDHGRPQKGETLVVGAASGAVGSVVGQLGKIHGMRVVGVAGGAEKCNYVVNELGFDACIDHRASADANAMRSELAAACPAGIDVYFENVGDKTLEAVIPLMNDFGRIPVCGTIAWYSSNGTPPQGDTYVNPLANVWRSILVKRLSVRGFIIFDHYDRFPDFIGEVAKHVREKRIVYRESVTDGLENAPGAFMSLLRGGNFGKQLVAISADPTRAS